MVTAATIRAVFLNPSPAYSVREAATLLGMDVDDVRGWMEFGEVEGVRRGREIVIEWPELVSFALDFWSQESVEEALGAELADALPELLRLADLNVRIPCMQVIALERVAAKKDESVSAVLARELRDFVSAHAEWLSVEVVGFAEALQWPEST